MNGAPAFFMLWIEGFIALAIMLGFVLHAFIAFKLEHVEHHPARVRVGAAIQGLVMGLMIGFVIVPLRAQLMGAGMTPGPAMASLAFLPAVVLLILIRRGALLKAPVLSTYLRAYRRAGLLKARDDANKALTKLDEIEGRSTAT